MKNVLFINYGGIGDEILFLPAISSFKEIYPEARITLALEPRSKSIKDLTNLIDDIILVDIKAKGIKKYFNIPKFIVTNWFKNFDCVISSGKNPLVAIILFLSGIKNRTGYSSRTDFLLTNSVKLNENQYAACMYHDLVKPFTGNNYQDPRIDIIGDFSLDEKLKEKEYIVIHPGVSKMSISKNIFKCPKINFWRDLISGLLSKNQKVVLLGTNDDKDLIDEILSMDNIINNPNFVNFCNKTKNIMEMAYIMKKSKSVICVDSAPLHVAVGVGANIYAIFGPTNEKKLTPKNNNIKIIKNNISCRPCLWDKKNQNCSESYCLNIDFNLILDNIC